MKLTEHLAGKQHGRLPIVGKVEEQALQCTHLLRVGNTTTELGQASTFHHTCSCDEGIKSVQEHQRVREKFASLLRQHGRAKDLSQGHLVHIQITMLGYEDTTFLANGVIEMYGKCGQAEDAKTLFERLVQPNIFSFNIALKMYGQNGMLDSAREMFGKMTLRDAVSWSTMIGCLSQCGHYGKALDVYSEMAIGSIKPDNVTFVCVLNACSNLALLKEGIEVHASIIAQKFESDVIVGTALINMYGKCGQVLSSVNVFNQMSTRDSVCWNAMMTVYAQNGHGQAALFLFKSMLNEGIECSNISFLRAAEACAGLCLLKEGQRIHSIIINSGILPDVTLQNTLVNMYGKCGKLHLAGFVFESMPFRDVASYSAMVAVFSQNEKNYEALCVYDNMRGAGLGPNNMTFVSVLNACASLEALEGGQLIHNTTVVDCVCSDNMIEIALIHMYGKCSSICNAEKVFWETVSQDVVAWNVMITSLVHNNHSEDALKYFHYMLNKGFLPDDYTYASVLDVCACVDGLLLGQQIFTALIHLGYQQDSFIQTSLISMYGRCGDLRKAKNALDSFSALDVAAMNAYLSVLMENGHEKEALDFFRTMLLSGIRPDKISFVQAFDACATLVVFEDGKDIHDIFIGLEYKEDLVVGTALISMYGKCGSLLHARSVFDKIQQWDLVLCNAMTSACAQRGHVAGAFSIFRRMQGEGIKPDRVTFISILTACSHAGEVEEGRHLFVSMCKDHGLKHMEDHYVCMIDILGRTGNLDEAEEMMKRIPCDVSATMWLALLGGCQMHGDVERGWVGARACTHLDPEDASVYVLMSNISVVAGIRHF